MQVSWRCRCKSQSVSNFKRNNRQGKLRLAKLELNWYKNMTKASFKYYSIPSYNNNNVHNRLISSTVRTRCHFVMVYALCRTKPSIMKLRLNENQINYHDTNIARFTVSTLLVLFQIKSIKKVDIKRKHPLNEEKVFSIKLVNKCICINKLKIISWSLFILEKERICKKNVLHWYKNFQQQSITR